MLLAVLAANLGVLWVAVEATTVVTTFLVGHRRTKGALEASWKYIVICSVGIALAFLGTVLVYWPPSTPEATRPAPSTGRRSWPTPTTSTPRCCGSAFALVVLGYGTKVGLAPMHSWLPDAHSQAPAPISALMSGVLLTVAFYAILRFKAVADLALGPGFSRTLLVIVALLSLAVAASLLLTQRDYKRMLAYHSIEHMGLIALGAAAGHPARHRRRAAAHPRPRPGQERAVPDLGRDHGRRGHQPDRRGPGPARPTPRPRRGLRLRAGGPARASRPSACSPAS